MPELLLSQRFEVPVYSGSGRHLLSFLTGDAAQQESFSCHGFSQGVHLRTAAVTLRHCRGRGRRAGGRSRKKHLFYKKNKKQREKETKMQKGRDIRKQEHASVLS